MVRAPIQRTSIPAVKQASTCWVLATSVATGIPVSWRAATNQSKAGSPRPSNELGRVRGFQTPARNKWMPECFNARAVSNTCFSDSALQGPLIRNGR